MVKLTCAYLDTENPLRKNMSICRFPRLKDTHYSQNDCYIFYVINVTLQSQVSTMLNMMLCFNQQLNHILYSLKKLQDMKQASNFHSFKNNMHTCQLSSYTCLGHIKFIPNHIFIKQGIIHALHMDVAKNIMPFKLNLGNYEQ